jgi:hypothetical protein
LAAGVAAVVVTFALAGAADEPDSETAGERTTTASVTTEAVGVPSSEPPGVTLAPVSAGHPIGWSVVDVGDSAGRVDALDPTAGWIAWSIPVPQPLAELAPASAVVASTTDGVLHRFEFPSGRVSSYSLSPSVVTGQLAVAGDSVAVPVAGGVVIVRSDGSSTVWNADTDRVPRVATFGSRFMVTVAGDDATERQWSLGPDGTATELTDGPFASFPVWDQRFTSAGELLADDGDDEVVVVDPERGVRSIDRGRLAAAGSHHYVTRTCAAGGCDYTLVDLATGQRTIAPLGVLDAYRYFDTSIRTSPDGRYVQYADWRRERPVSRIVDLSDGVTIDAGDLGDVRAPDAWAADSSGVFVAGDDGLVFRSVDGRVAVVDGLGPLRSVATMAGG